MKIIGVIANNFEVASKFLDDIIGEMPYKMIKRVNRNSYVHEVELLDGSIYKVIGTNNNSARGHRFTDLYLQKELDKEFLDCIVLPYLIRHDDGSEPTVIYFE